MMDGSGIVAPPPVKLTHADVHYGMGKRDGDRCDHCRFYRGPNDCEIVAAPIYPAGWCDKFQPKSEAAAPMNGGLAPAPLMHGRAIAGAKALHAVGHISAPERDKHIMASQTALRQSGAKPRKPFGSWAQ